MKGAIGEVVGVFPGLQRAVDAWVVEGDSRPLVRWLGRQLDQDGVPLDLPVSDWGHALALIAEAQRRRAVGWPEAVDALVEGWVRSLLRFSRPDGSPAMSQPLALPEIGKLLRGWVRRLSDPGLETVVSWWFPARTRGRGHAAPPLPAWSRGDRPFAVLRANWSAEGDFVAVDHRLRGASSSFELFGLGRTWLGPDWAFGGADSAATRARPTCWHSDSSADLAEWTFRAGESRVVRSAALLRGRQIAVLADQVEGGEPVWEMRLGLPELVITEPVAESRALGLVARGGRARARVFPLALPRRPEGVERGSLAADGSALVLKQPAEARRSWLPLVVSWSPERNRRAAHWRTLTVSEKSKPCPPGTAFAARLSWGRGETLVVYRSLGRPALRSFLGHQTRARYLIGLFTSEGRVEPILKVDE
ncbi:MAG: hypothetical protein P4L84_12105 [Isosphaeraceae bacterium]|nr:hypothetical protein [Isosphaeraceae bacterium]